MSRHIATIAAFEHKLGGYMGVILNRQTRERRAERFATLEEAKHWAKTQAYDAYNEVGYSLAALRLKGEYQANVWIA